MSRPTRIQVDTEALVYNLNHIKNRVPQAQIVAMVKANAYGCGLEHIVPTLQDKVAAFGVASIEEGMRLRKLTNAPCVIFQGIFQPEEVDMVEKYSLQIVIHQQQQIDWITAVQQKASLKVWLKVNTGMNRLGILPTEVPKALEQLQNCAWIDPNIVIMTHLACADELQHPYNDFQIAIFNNLDTASFKTSIINSAGIVNFPELAADYVRPGIMLYGISPIAEATGRELGLRPAIRFTSKIIAIQQHEVGTSVGYGATWKTEVFSKIAIIPAGYGDGYPRYIAGPTYVGVQGQRVPIVGRISMDTMTIDVTALAEVRVGDEVELWGSCIPIEEVAKSANTIPHALLTQLTERARGCRSLSL